MRSYTDPDLIQLRETLKNEKGIIISSADLIKIVASYENVLRSRLEKGESVIISGVGRIEVALRLVKIPKYFAGKKRREEHRYVIRFQPTKSLKEILNKEIKKKYESHAGTNLPKYVADNMEKKRKK